MIVNNEVENKKIMWQECLEKSSKQQRLYK